MALFCPYLSYFAEFPESNGSKIDIERVTDGPVYNGATIIGTAKIHRQDLPQDPENPEPENLGAMVHMDCIEALCQLWDTRHSRCGIKVTDYNQGYGDGIIICPDDQCSGGGGTPIVAPLVAEYHGNEDLDGNGLIYGVDFVLSDPPPMLQGIPEGAPATMTLAEYAASRS